MSVSTLTWPDFALHIPATVRDLDSFRDWAHADDFPERGTISFLRGEIIIDMSPQEFETHLKVSGAIFADLYQLVSQEDLGELFPDGAMIVNEQADVSNEPDMTFCRWETLRSGRASYRLADDDEERVVEIVGSPDLVLEVVSRSSVTKDTKQLPVCYFDAGIEEYWIVDARGKQIEFQILVRGKKRYRKMPTDRDGFVASKVFSRRCRLRRDSNPVGRYRYRLETKAND